jgi:hypothetical protein
MIHCGFLLFISPAVFADFFHRYDMYSGDSRVPSTVPMEGIDHDALHPSESGPALEVIELANGETIWLVVPLIVVTYF